MGSAVEIDEQRPAALPAYGSILVAVDASDHANRGVEEACLLASLWGASLTGSHVYAAQMHDRRFRQMEGGLPEQFRAEDELERQRDVHDELITRGLSIITDSYLDQAERVCTPHAVALHRRSLEGKNYRALLTEADSGNYDLLVMGALGVGAIEGSRLGTVCERVVRRIGIDTLIIREPDRALSEGPILVAIDGSARAFGGLLSALALARLWRVPVEVVAAYDPFFHYVAFNRIAGVLSDEAGKVFRFKDQEKLHEEIIDAGLAKIYEGHLRVAESVAADHGMRITTRLLDGKPYDAVARHAAKFKPSLLVLGKLGVHADQELDIGGNAEHLLRRVDCAVLLSQRQHQPRVDQIAEVSTSWTLEAEQRMTGVPDFVRPMARMAILRYAQERGHTVITARIVDQATAELMPGRGAAAGSAPGDANDEPLAPSWTPAGEQLLAAIEDASLRANLRLRAEKKARAEGAAEVLAIHVSAFFDAAPPPAPAARWQSAALARLMRVPEGFMRDGARTRVEQRAAERGEIDITLELTETVLAEARQAMNDGFSAGESGKTEYGAARCPFAGHAEPPVDDSSVPLAWSAEAQARLAEVPAGLCRDMTRKATETRARELELTEIHRPTLEAVIGEAMGQGSEARPSLPWDDDASATLAHSPPAIRARLTRESEAHARHRGGAHVRHHDIDAVETEWRAGGDFRFDDSGAAPAGELRWSAAAEARIAQVPEGFMRELTRRRVEVFARRAGAATVTIEHLEGKFADWNAGSRRQRIEMDWSAATRERIERIPSFVRGMVIKEVERYAERLRLQQVTSEVLDRAMQEWRASGQFHGPPDPAIHD